MIISKTFVLTSVGIILLFIVYNSKKSPVVENFENNKNHPTIVDELLLSQHKYELSDCLRVNIHCDSDIECSEICNQELNWECKKNQCTLKNKIPKPNCIHGHLQIIYDPEKIEDIKYKCICTNAYYYGNDCSKIIKYCDNIEENKCVCRSDKVLMKYFEHYEVCVPRKHYKLFSKQSHFKATDGV
jgi:hypothetical protein